MCTRPHRSNAGRRRRAGDPNGGSGADAEVRGRFFVTRNVPLESKTDNSIEASTSATTLADHSPSSDTVLNVGLDQNIMWSFSYNANGDLTERLETVHNSAVQWSYCYSTDGWLTKATKIVDGETDFTEQYWYDPIGRKYKIATTEDAQTTTRYFVYDGGSIVLELEEDGGDYLLEKEHIRGLSLGGGIGGLLYTRDLDGSVGYFHYDGQGNVVSITDDSREEVAYYEYDAWGNVLTACGSLANEFRFSTKQASLGTGLIDFGYRWYDPSIGRWTQRDPLGTAAGPNNYGFVFGDPVNYVDPFGLLPWWVDMALEIIIPSPLYDTYETAEAMVCLAKDSVEVHKQKQGITGWQYFFGKLLGMVDIAEGAHQVDMVTSERLSLFQSVLRTATGTVKATVFVYCVLRIARPAPKAPPTRGLRGPLTPAQKAQLDAFAARCRRLRLVENPNRTGSWGVTKNGTFKEVARMDVGKPGAPGYEGKTHIHVGGGKEHLPPETKLPGEGP